MTRLPDRERILNAYAAGFAPRWIAQRFGKNCGAVEMAIFRAREAGDPRAAYADPLIALGRKRAAASRRFWPVRPDHDLSAADQFPDLPEISEPMLPFAGRIPQAVGEP
jgi:hypothetical protein